ncbi:hypothetical protein [Ilumatobacter sp.]
MLEPFLADLDVLRRDLASVPARRSARWDPASSGAVGDLAGP